jgi:hypothetical protein
VKHEDVMVMIGDFNASMGVQTEVADVVLGTNGLPHQNKAGGDLKVLAGLHDMRDLISRQTQKFYGTWHCMGSNLPHQLDNAFMQNRHLATVKKCVNATPLVNTDHASTRLHLKIEKAPSPPRTVRQELAHAGVAEWLHDCARDEKIKLGGLAAQQHRVECAHEEGRSEYELLMSAVSKVLESAPERKRSPRGWCDLNVAELPKGIEVRNAAARMFVRTRDDETKRVYTIARQKLKKIKTRLKNEWLMEQLKQCNDSILPSGKDRKSGKATWALGKKLQRSVDKWRDWGGKNVRDAKGVMGTNPKENIQNFKAFYENLFSDKITGGAAAEKWCDEMESFPQDREWTAPILPELKKAVAELKSTAPGLSGTPGVVWKILCGDGDCRGCLLKTMVECWNTGTTPTDWTSHCLTGRRGDWR